MNVLTVSTEPTMSSREIAELIASGEASGEQALRFASSMVSELSRAIRDVSKLCVNKLREEAKVRLDDLSEQMALARAISRGMSNYPEAGDLLASVLSICLYAEATLAPAALLWSCGGDDATKTYVVRNPDSGLIKIGRSIDVSSRIRALETGSGQRLEVLHVIERDVERELHRRFDDLRTFGEWFRDDGRIVAYLCELQGT